MTPESARLRSLLAITIRHHGRGPEAERLARDLRAARAEEYLRELVADEPPLTGDQRIRLVRVLAGVGDVA